MTGKRICIATLDPSSGGVSSMARFVYNTAEQAGYDPYIAYNSLDFEEDTRIWEPYKGLDVEVTHTTVNGMEARHVPRVFPEFEFAQYRFNHRGWKEMISDSDICFGVGGNNHCCHPFLLENRPFGCWVATPLWEDRANRLPNESLLWQFRDYLSRPLLERLERRIFEESNIIFALSEYTAERIADLHDIPLDSIEILPFPIDTHQFSPKESSDEEYSIEHEWKKIGEGGEYLIQFVGRYTDPRKNTSMLVEAFAEVYSLLPNCRLQLIGSEPTTELVQYINELGIQDAVEFIEHIPNHRLPSYYTDADVFVIPSYQEGLAIVGLEAMACGTPVISTRCGGPEQYIEDGQTGLLVPVDDADSLAVKIKELLENSNKRKELGEKARKEVKKNYSQTKLAPKFVDAFERLGCIEDRN